MIEEKEFLDFLYIGAPRSGSTWLYGALDQHPEIWVPHNKEVHFFNERMPFPYEYKYPRGIDYYKKYFEGAPHGSQLGELSPFYYYDPKAAERIYSHFPNVKIIAFLRNPVDMIHSLYLRMRRLYSRESTFEHELMKHPNLIDLGCYYRNLLPYFDRFPPENLYIQVYENAFEDEEMLCESVYKFLSVDKSFRPNVVGKRVNYTKSEKQKLRAKLRETSFGLLHSRRLGFVKEVLHKLKVNKQSYSGIAKNDTNIERPSVPQQLRETIMSELENDICELERALKVDLTFWREDSKNHKS